MKNNYSKTIRSLSILLLMFMSLISYSQNIQFTFANSENTNDGVDDYYEVDVMIQTIDGQSDFKLGSGQIYFNYNTAAFGESAVAAGSFDVTASSAEGYFLGEKFAGVIDLYDISTVNDNSASRASWAFSQLMSSGTMTELVSSTPRKLAHLKVKYLDVNEDPMFTFESDEGVVTGCRDQFFTACGPFDSQSNTLDCSSDVDAQNVNIQFLDAVFESSGATLTDKDFALLTGLTLYPNPTNGILNIEGDTSKIQSIDIYNIVGQHVKTISNQFKTIDIGNLESGLYLLKVAGESESFTTRVIKN